MFQLYHIRIFLDSNLITSNNEINGTITLRPDGSIVESKLKNKYGLGPYYRIKDSDSLVKNKERCVICLEDYKSGTYKRKLSCGHIFHKKCIDKWFKKSNNINCSVCRKMHNSLLTDLDK